MQITSIAVIRLSSLGDVLLTTPVIKTLREKYPNASIDFYTRNTFAAIYRHNPRINNLYLLERTKESEAQFSEQLQSGGYSFVVDLQSNLRSRLLTRGLPCKVYRFNKRRLEKLLLVHLKMDLFPAEEHITARYKQTVPALPAENEVPELFLPEGLLPSPNLPKNAVALCPGAKHFTKRYPAEKFAEVARLLLARGYSVCCIGGKSDTVLCNAICSLQPAVVNLTNNDDLYATAINLKHCVAVVTNDSAHLHIAQAMGTPVTALFGSTVSAFGFFPVAKNSLLLEVNSLSCRPCTHTGRSNCPKGHLACLQNIEPAKIELALSALLNPMEFQEDR